MEIEDSSSLESRDKLREERRIRNKLKRERNKLQKNINKQCEQTLKNEQGNSIVKIVSKEFHANFNQKRNCDNQSKKYNIKIPEILNVERRTPVIEQATVSRCEKIHGNALDSSNPIRFTGKQREIPKQPKLSRLKKDILEQQNASTTINYCDNVISDELVQLSEALIVRITELQEKLYKKDEAKGVAKRKYIVGFHQLRKFLLAKRVKVAFIATDLKIGNVEDVLYEKLNEVLKIAQQNETIYVFVHKRRKLGNLTPKHIPASCLGVLDCDGAHEEYKMLVDEIKKCKKLYLENNSNTENNDDIHRNLIKKLQDALKT